MLRNIIWDYLGRFGNLGITFIVSVILTRLLSPAEYGIMGMAMVVIGIAAVFVDLGFYRAIVQKQETTEVELSTIFYINLAFAFCLTSLCFLLARPLANFYEQHLIEPVFKVLSLIFLSNALVLVPSALAQKRMKFRSITIINVVAISASGLLGILMALNGYGVWSLVGQSLTNSFLVAILHLIYARWWPLAVFNWTAVKPMWNYGSRLFATSLMELTFTRMDAFIIGKLFPVYTLGFYNRAQALEGMVRQLSISSFMTVLFPVIAKSQDDRVSLTDLYKKYLQIICFISFGLSGVFFLTGTYLFIVIYTEKWVFSGELFELMAAFMFIYPLTALMSNIITGVGNSKSYLRLELIKKVVLIPVYVFGFLWGLKPFIIILALANFINLVITTFFVTREVAVTGWQHFQVVARYFVVTVLSCGLTYLLLSLFNLDHNFLNLLVHGGLFVVMYLLLGRLFKLEGNKIIGTKMESVRKVYMSRPVKVPS